MRGAFVHEAALTLDPPDGDELAPGGAITVALCGHWEHEPPCPLAPHHTEARRDGADVRLRIVFVTEPYEETAVRRRIEAALAGDERWRLRVSARSDLTAGENALAARLMDS